MEGVIDGSIQVADQWSLDPSSNISVRRYVAVEVTVETHAGALLIGASRTGTLQKAPVWSGSSGNRMGLAEKEALGQEYSTACRVPS